MSFCPCAVDPTCNTDSVLQGQPLRVCDFSWFPFSTFPDGAAHLDTFALNEWTGADSELMRALADSLGFNLTVVKFRDAGANETWEDVLELAASGGECDVVASVWSKVPSRLSRGLTFLDTIFDDSSVLIASTNTGQPDAGGLLQQGLVIFRPFATSLWLVLLSAVFINAIGFYIVEWDGPDYEDTNALSTPRTSGLAKSVYLSMMLLTGVRHARSLSFCIALLLMTHRTGADAAEALTSRGASRLACAQAGGHSPTTMSGRLLLTAWSLLLVITVSWYTADLAGSLRASRLERQHTIYASLDNLAAMDGTLCIHNPGLTGWGAEQFVVGGVQAPLPAGLRTRVSPCNIFETPELCTDLVEGAEPLCDAFVTTNFEYSSAVRQNATFGCSFYQVGSPVRSNEASFVIGRHMNELCLAPALNFGLAYLRSTGQLQQILRRYVGPLARDSLYTCPGVHGTPSHDSEDAHIRFEDLCLVYLLDGAIVLSAAFFGLVKARPRWFPSFLHPNLTSKHPFMQANNFIKARASDIQARVSDIQAKIVTSA